MTTTAAYPLLSPSVLLPREQDNSRIFVRGLATTVSMDRRIEASLSLPLSGRPRETRQIISQTQHHMPNMTNVTKKESSFDSVSLSQFGFVPADRFPFEGYRVDAESELFGIPKERRNAFVPSSQSEIYGMKRPLYSSTPADPTENMSLSQKYFDSSFQRETNPLVGKELFGNCTRVQSRVAYRK